MDKKHTTLERVMQRVKYVAYKEAERKRFEEKEDQEREAWLSIDWHDFVVVETVQFTEVDDSVELPTPISVEDLESLTIAQRRMAAAKMTPLAPIPVERIVPKFNDDMEVIK